MKNILFLAAVLTALFLFNGNSYSQSDCCKEGASCCTEGASCCGTEASNTSQGVTTDSITAVKEVSVCPVSGEEFRKGKGKIVMVNDKEYEVCCGGCEKKLAANPEKYLTKTEETKTKDEHDHKNHDHNKAHE